MLGLSLSLGLGARSGGPVPVQKTTFLSAGATTWTVPADYVSLVSIKAIGEGGHGISTLTANGGGGAGGGGGAYAEITTLTASAGDVLPVQIGGGGEGLDTWLKDRTGAIAVKAACGRTPVSAFAPGAAGLAANSIGSVKNNGGAGGAGLSSTGSRGGAGGGGAGGSSGAGVAGTNAAANSSGQAGGASGGGTAGGALAGAGAVGNVGANGSDLATGFGTGGGGSGGGSSKIGGDGGKFGAGGGGGGTNTTTGADGGRGMPGLIQITYMGTASDSPAPYDIILLAGQSNMSGRGGTTLDSYDGIAQFMNFSGSGGLAGRNTMPAGYSAGQFRTILTNTTYLMHPEGGPASGSQGYGPGMDFARTWQLATGRRVLLVPCAYGSTALASGGAWASGGARRADAIATTNLALAAAQAIHPDSKVAAIFMSLGETDAVNLVSRSTFVAGAQDLIAALRAGITGAANVPVVWSAMVPEAITKGTNLPQYPDIDKAQSSLPFKISNLTWIQGPSGFDNGDNLHYSTFGQKEIGPKAALALMRQLSPFVGTAKSEVVYAFSRTDLGAAPMGLTSIGVNATAIVANAAQTGMAGRYLTSGGTLGTDDCMEAVLEAFDAQGPQVVEWVDGYASATPGRGGAKLRTQSGACVVGTTQFGKQGYYFEIDRIGGTVSIYRNDAAARTLLAGPVALTMVQGRTFRASAIGSVLTLSYSDDGGTNWTQIATATDSTWSSGQATIGAYSGSVVGATFYDTIKLRSAV